MTRTTFLLFSIALASLNASAATPSLVPDTPNTAPDYFCTWNVQGYVRSYAGANEQADAMVEANLFGKGSDQGWTAFFPEVRGDLIFLLDDATDYPLGGGHYHSERGSMLLHPQRFPSFQGPPVESMTKLNRAVQERGWRSLGLWVCNSRKRESGNESIESDAYWTERMGWSQQAGVSYWKVDWGTAERDQSAWHFKVTPRLRSAGPGVWIERAGMINADVYRTYDVQLVRSIPETIRRIAAFLAKADPKDRRMINCEDEVYIGAALGCHYGIMRHPLAGNLPNGKPDNFYPEGFRDVKRRMDEVTRAVRWHRIAQPIYKGDKFLIDATTLTDSKCEPAPARIARGGLALPKVSMPAGQEPPYVLCSRHEDGEIAIATIARREGDNGRPVLLFPLADVSLEVGELNRPIGIFGKYASLTLVTPSDLTGRRILAQDLAGSTPVDITKEVKVSKGALTIPGAVIHRLGLMAAKPGDVSDPALVLVVEGLTVFVPKKPMKPGVLEAQPGSNAPLSNKAPAPAKQ